MPRRYSHSPLRPTQSLGVGNQFAARRSLSQDHSAKGATTPAVSPTPGGDLRVKVLSRPSVNYGRASSLGHGAAGVRGANSLQQLNESLNFLLPMHHHVPSKSSENIPMLLRRSTSASLRTSPVSPQIEGDVSPAPAEVYHTVHGGTKKPILASRKPEPFSRIVRRYPSLESGRKTTLPSLTEQSVYHWKAAVRPAKEDQREGGIKNGHPVLKNEISSFFVSAGWMTSWHKK